MSDSVDGVRPGRWSEADRAVGWVPREWIDGRVFWPGPIHQEELLVGWGDRYAVWQYASAVQHGMSTCAPS
ncbi:hypothetical protein M0804_008167 [Polistes exclamans]|nr:hypothetical protein M0804_008167 [Polistes exclamans]